MHSLFRDLPASAYPFRVAFFDASDPDSPCLQVIAVSGPGAVIVPSFAPLTVAVYAEFADGDVSYYNPLIEALGSP